MKQWLTAAAAGLVLMAHGPANAQNGWVAEPDPELPGGPGGPTGPSGPGGTPSGGGGTPSGSAYPVTTLRIGLLDPRPQTPVGVRGLNVSTSDLDPKLARLGLGPDYLRRRAGEAFEDITEFERDLSSDLRAGLEAVSSVIDVPRLDIGADPIRVRFNQIGRNVGARIGDIDVRAKIRFDLPWYVPCNDLTVWTTLRDVAIEAQYDVYNGRLASAELDFRVTQGTVNEGFVCAGIPVGWLVDAFIDEKALIERQIRNGFENEVDNLDLDTMYNVRNLLIGTDTVLNEASRLGLPQGPVADARDVVAMTRRTLEDPNFAGSNVQVDFILTRGSTNDITIVASHAREPRISRLEYLPNSIEAWASTPPGSRRVLVYAAPSGGRYYGYAGQMRYGRLMLPTYDRGTSLVGVAESSLFRGLYSFPGPIRRTSWDYTCTGNDPDCREIY